MHILYNASGVGGGVVLNFVIMCYKGWGWVSLNVI